MDTPSSDSPFPRHAHILGSRVDAINYEDACHHVCASAKNGRSEYICVATVNNVMEGHDSPTFRDVTNGAALVSPDGMPLVWALRLLGYRSATRVYGPDLTPLVLERAAREKLPVGFYGGSAAVLQKLVEVVSRRFPGLNVAYAFSPPYRALTAEEDRRVVHEINTSGTRILFIGLNTPKQDYWMAGHKDKVQAVMIGVGAAFDFLAGAKPQAPRWMMRIGTEWVFRLATEPRRLWKRYLKHNPRFVLLFAAQLLRARTEERVTSTLPTADR